MMNLPPTPGVLKARPTRDRRRLHRYYDASPHTAPRHHAIHSRRHHAQRQYQCQHLRLRASARPRRATHRCRCRHDPNADEATLATTTTTTDATSRLRAIPGLSPVAATAVAAAVVVGIVVTAATTVALVAVRHRTHHGARSLSFTGDKRASRAHTPTPLSDQPRNRAVLPDNRRPYSPPQAFAHRDDNATLFFLLLIILSSHHRRSSPLSPPVRSTPVPLGDNDTHKLSSSRVRIGIPDHAQRLTLYLDRSRLRFLCQSLPCVHTSPSLLHPRSCPGTTFPSSEHRRVHDTRTYRRSSPTPSQPFTPGQTTAATTPDPARQHVSKTSDSSTTYGKTAEQPQRCVIRRTRTGGE